MVSSHGKGEGKGSGCLSSLFPYQPLVTLSLVPMTYSAFFSPSLGQPQGGPKAAGSLGQGREEKIRLERKKGTVDEEEALPLPLPTADRRERLAALAVGKVREGIGREKNGLLAAEGK